VQRIERLLPCGGGAIKRAQQSYCGVVGNT
jgi:hypothetical protein